MDPVPQLAPHSLLVFLAAIAVLLAVARLLGRLAGRIGMPAIVGELATGVILGPSLLRTLVLSVLAPLFLATAGLRVDITVLDEELLRKIDHDTWDGDERVHHAAAATGVDQISA